MNLAERIGLALLHRTDPERAHALSLRALKMGLVTQSGPLTGPRLVTRLAGLNLPNPVGLAAGFDKNGEVLKPLSQAGFGFMEIGATTPLPQPGNPRPRLFRLPQDQAVINRFGFNNKGMEAMAAQLAVRPRGAVIGLNLGANKNSRDRATDYSTVLECCGEYLDFATVNVSSPNTERLRNLQGRVALTGLLKRVMETRATLKHPIPVFLKIAPDLEDAELADIADVARETGVNAIIATNTTLSRTGLRSAQRGQNGGLSGQPLFEKSTRILARLHHMTGGEIPLVGVGGIGSARQAYEKIRAGASAVQLYTAMVYRGLSLVGDIVRGLDQLLENDGYANIAEAVGTGEKEWL